MDDDGRRGATEPAYTISSPGAFGSGELKMRMGVGWGWGEVEGTLKPKQYARLSREVKYKTATIYTM